MKKIKLILPVLILLLHFNCSPAQNSIAQINSTKSIAIILKLTGDEKHITNTEVYSYNVYAGKAKNTAEPSPVAASIVRMKAFDEKNQLIFDGYFDNPLKQKFESFEEDGKVTNTIKNSTSGFINIRFALNSETKNIRLNCYTLNKDKEELVSTNQITVK